MTPVLATKKLEIEGAITIDTPQFKDKRGSFMELFNLMRFHDAGLHIDWMQDNLVFNEANVLRGLHIQKRRPQGKLLNCVQGKIIDVGVDLRKHSPSFKKAVAVELSASTQMVYWPPGIAHGYYSEFPSTVIYKCTTIYDKETDGGILWCDPDLGINWGDISPVVSQKDMCLPKMRDYLNSLS